METPSPLDFLNQAQTDPKLSARVVRAIERGGRVTGEEVLEIAQEFGFSFTREEFERAVLQDMARRFEAGESKLGDLMDQADAPESSCATGCVSWTTNYHPPPPVSEVSA